MDVQGLIRAAYAATLHARAPYSGFKVGAALLCADGTVYTGVNVESSSYGLTICAERVALFKALSEGRDKFQAIAIICANRTWCPPCGACRQVLWDWGRDLDVILAKDENDYQLMKLSALLPHAFDNGYLIHD